MGRIAYYSNVIWYILTGDKCHSSDLHIIPYRDGTYDCSIGSNRHIPTDSRMAFSPFFSCTTESNSMKYGHTISDDSRLSDNDTHTMIDHHTFANLGSWMDLNSCEASHNLRYHPRYKSHTKKIELMSKYIDELRVHGDLA